MPTPVGQRERRKALGVGIFKLWDFALRLVWCRRNAYEFSRRGSVTFPEAGFFPRESRNGFMDGIVEGIAGNLRLDEKGLRPVL